MDFLKKHIVWILLASTITGATILNAVEPTNPTHTNTVSETRVKQSGESVKSPYQHESVQLSNDNYYTNTAGENVHSPAYAPSIPSDASAKCRDGTYSFSQNRRGTCSHHGGVAIWY